MDRLEALLAYYKEDPEDNFTRFALASEYLKRGNKKEACTFFEELIATSPNYIGTYYHLGKLYEDLTRTDDAIRIYQAGIQQAMQNKDFHARAELQDALLQAQGFGFDDD